MAPLLLLLIPIAAAVLIVFAPARQAKWIALFATTAAFTFNVMLAWSFEQWGTAHFGLEASYPILEQFDLSLRFGVDAVSMWLTLLTTLLMPLCIWGSFTAVQTRLREYYGWMLVLQAAMVGVFLARDIIFFYICFELTLVPMYFLIAIYGGANRSYAAIKFFVITFTGSLMTLAGLLYIAWQYSLTAGIWTFDIALLTEFAATTLNATQQLWLLLAMMIGFGVKVPLFPVHTWLPLAHTEAPTAGSVILAGVLLKLGTYGLYRFVLPMVPTGLLEQTSFFGWEFIPVQLIAYLAIIGIIYAALICWVQDDVKKLVAYSSVSHLGFCVLGLFALNPLGAQGSLLYMLNHGLSTGALFFLIGMIYERYHTRDMNAMSGLGRKMPIWAFFMVFFVLSSVGLPGLNGFVSEFLCLIAAFTSTADNAAYPGMLGPWYALIAGSGMILAAMYLLIMVGKVVFGPLKEPPVHGHDDALKLPADLTWREIGVLTPLAILCVYLGLQPTPIMDSMQGSVEATLAAYPDAVREKLAEHEARAAIEETSVPFAEDVRFALTDDGAAAPQQEGGSDVDG